METTAIEYGRVLIEIGTALLQGRLRFVESDHSAQIPARDVERQLAPSVSQFPASVGSGRPGARGVWSARKGYHVVKQAKGKLPVIDGITPAGVRLIEYLQRHPGKSSMMIAGDLGLSRKTVENLLSLLRQRHLIETEDLTHQE